MRRPEKNQNGIAMMVVLWVLVLLIALATEFAFSMKMEINTTRNFKEDFESYYLAKAGIALAMSELLKPARFHSIHPEHGWVSGKPLVPGKGAAEKNEFEDDKEKEPEYEIIEREKIPFGNGEVTYTITDENGKIAINTASRGVLAKVLKHAGIELGEERDIIIDSILDWIDPDSNHRINGAENDYYKNEGLPYTAKNGRIETLTELLKVRGMTKEIFYGSGGNKNEDYQGLEKILTVYDASPVNPNTASPEVLSVLFDETQAQDILTARKEKGYYNDTTSTHFRILSTGSLSGSKTRHTLSVVLEKPKAIQGSGLLTHYWNDNFIEP
jgi:general secretion pathway protein K